MSVQVLVALVAFCRCVLLLLLLWFVNNSRGVLRLSLSLSVFVVVVVVVVVWLFCVLAPLSTRLCVVASAVFVLSLVGERGGRSQSACPPSGVFMSRSWAIKFEIKTRLVPVCDTYCPPEPTHKKRRFV